MNRLNLFAISGLTICLTSLVLAIVIILSTGKNRGTAYFWLAVCALVFTWGLSSFGIATTSIKEVAAFWWRIGHIGAIFMPAMVFNFIYLLLKLNKPWHKFILYASYFCAAILTYVNFIPSNTIFLDDLRMRFNQFYYLDWSINKNPLYLIFYIVFYWIFSIYSFLILLNAYKSSKGIFRNQLRYFILASLLIWIGPHGLFLITFRQDIYPYSNFALAISPLIYVYAIYKHKLMDLTLVITRAGIFIFTYTPILGLPFAMVALFRQRLFDSFGATWWIIPLMLMGLLATIGPFIYIYLERKAEERLMQDQKRYHNILKQTSSGINRIRNLKKLLELLTTILTRTVKISYAEIYLYDQRSERYILQASRGKERISAPEIAADTPLVKWMVTRRQPLLYEEIKRRAEDSDDEIYKQLKENMQAILAALIIPSLLDNKPMGFIVLGEKVSGQAYTNEDLNVFQMLASQAALAIENAEFIEESKEIQSQIAQSEKMATIGTMADGLSHQINNRFHNLSMLSGDMFDIIKKMDSSQFPPELKKNMDVITHIASRIEFNVQEGGKIVRDILKYTRKEEMVFENLTLDQIIDASLDITRYKINLAEIDIIRDYPRDLPKLKANLVQLEEVFINLIDNAYDAITERRTTLKEPGYRGKIIISAIPKDGFLEIVVRDNGIGIKDENIKKIFTPFFTTKSTSFKGTGLGLYVINRIIKDGHKGKISFASRYQVGSQFNIELPADLKGVDNCPK